MAEPVSVTPHPRLAGRTKVLLILNALVLAGLVLLAIWIRWGSDHQRTAALEQQISADQQAIYRLQQQTQSLQAQAVQLHTALDQLVRGGTERFEQHAQQHRLLTAVDDTLQRAQFPGPLPLAALVALFQETPAGQSWLANLERLQLRQARQASACLRPLQALRTLLWQIPPDLRLWLPETVPQASAAFPSRAWLTQQLHYGAGPVIPPPHRTAWQLWWLSELDLAELAWQRADTEDFQQHLTVLWISLNQHLPAQTLATWELSLPACLAEHPDRVRVDTLATLTEIRNQLQWSGAVGP